MSLEQTLNDTLTQAIRDKDQRMADIVRKIGRITRYETKSYVGAAKIIDLDRSTQAQENLASATETDMHKRNDSNEDDHT